MEIERRKMILKGEEANLTHFEEIGRRIAAEIEQRFLSPEAVTVREIENIKQTVATLRGDKMPQYDDRQVVCAFNSCFDLTKWKELPSTVRDRFKTLLQHNRIKFVCFTDTAGAGLRIYKDEMNVKFDDGDECEPAPGGVMSQDNSGRVDIGGYWMQCPGSEWKDGGKEVLITNASATKFLRRYTLSDNQRENFDVDGVAYWWTTSRIRATKFRDDEAKQISQKIGKCYIVDVR